MAEEIHVTDPLNVPVVFVNQVLGQGHVNGVVNITFGTARFTPSGIGEIDIDMVVGSRLRMDMACARQLRDNLSALLDKQPEANNAEEKLN